MLSCEITLKYITLGDFENKPEISQPEEEKKEEGEKKEIEKPNFNPSGILAKFTNSVK